MRLTMKGDYGLRAMIDLAAHYGQGPVPSADIARRQAIPEHFLDQVLVTLRRAGLLRSQRGPQGGHLLARAPVKITMGDIVRAIDGTLAPMECLPNPASCQLSAGCALRDVWAEVESETSRVLDGTTLDQLARRHQPVAEQAGVSYTI